MDQRPELVPLRVKGCHRARCCVSWCDSTPEPEGISHTLTDQGPASRHERTPRIEAGAHGPFLRLTSSAQFRTTFICVGLALGGYECRRRARRGSFLPGRTPRSATASDPPGRRRAHASQIGATLARSNVPGLGLGPAGRLYPWIVPGFYRVARTSVVACGVRRLPVADRWRRSIRTARLQRTPNRMSRTMVCWPRVASIMSR